MRLIQLVSTLIFIGLLTACGQKGDLYLPDQTAHPATKGQAAAGKGDMAKP